MRPTARGPQRIRRPSHIHRHGLGAAGYLLLTVSAALAMIHVLDTRLMTRTFDVHLIMFNLSSTEIIRIKLITFFEKSHFNTLTLWSKVSIDILL